MFNKNYTLIVINWLIGLNKNILKKKIAFGCLLAAQGGHTQSASNTGQYCNYYNYK